MRLDGRPGTVMLAALRRLCVALDDDPGGRPVTIYDAGGLAPLDDAF